MGKKLTSNVRVSVSTDAQTIEKKGEIGAISKQKQLFFKVYMKRSKGQTNRIQSGSDLNGERHLFYVYIYYRRERRR